MTKHRKTRLKCVLQVASHSSPTSANHAWRLGFLFTLLVFCRDGAVVASSGTWKATGMEWRPCIKQPFQPFSEQLLQLLPGNYKAGTGLSLTDTSCTCPIWYKHWQFTLGIWRPDKMWSEWETSPPGLWKESWEGRIITYHLNLLLVHTYSIIFGNGCQHIRQKQVVQHFGFTRNILEWAGSAQQLPGQGSSTAGHLAHNGQLSSFWFFSHLVQTCHHPVLCKQLALIKAHWLSLLCQEPGNLGSSPVLKKASRCVLFVMVYSTHNPVCSFQDDGHLLIPYAPGRTHYHTLAVLWVLTYLLR